MVGSTALKNRGDFGGKSHSIISLVFVSSDTSCIGFSSSRTEPKAKAMKNVSRGSVVFCALVAVMGCRAPSPDWNGTWKLSPTKSSYRGPVLTISISADGDYRFDENSSHTLRCDGKDHPIGNNRTLALYKTALQC